MNINEVKQLVSNKKSGILVESTVPDFLVFSDGYYDIAETCFIVHESLTLDGKRKFIINNQFIQSSSYQELDESIDEENSKFTRLFDGLCQTEHSEESFTDMFAYMFSGDDSTDIANTFVALMKSGNYPILETADTQRLKTLISEKVNRFKSFNTIPNTTVYLDEGMIKVPPKTLSYIKTVIDVLTYQLAINNVYDHSAYELMLSFLASTDIMVTDIKGHSDEIMGRHISYDTDNGFSGSLNLKMDKDDIPYNTRQKFIPLTVVFTNQSSEEGSNGTLNGQPVITINTSRLEAVFNSHDVMENPLLFKNKEFIDRVKSIKEFIMSTVIHELMHVMQHTIFANNEYASGSMNPKSIEKNDDSHEDYLTSQVEFDPMISDLIGNFKRLIHGIEDYMTTTLDDNVKRELLKKYLSSGYIDTVPSYFDKSGDAMKSVIKQVFSPPEFVELIKNTKPDKYPRMVKKIYSELGY